MTGAGGVQVLPGSVRPRLAIYRSVNVHSVGAVVRRRHRECVDLVTSLGGSIDVARDVYVDNVSTSRRSPSGFHVEMERLLQAVASGRYDGVVVWQLPGQLASVERRGAFQRVMVAAACDIYVVTCRHLSMFGSAGSLFAL